MSDYFTVLLATLAAFAVGALWYGPLFGKTWRRLMGLTDEAMRDMKFTPFKAMAGGFVATLILTYALALLMGAVFVSTLAEALQLSLLVSIGFIATTQLNAVWYENRPVKLWLINASHYVVALLAAALVLFYA